LSAEASDVSLYTLTKTVAGAMFFRFMHIKSIAQAAIEHHGSNVDKEFPEAAMSEEENCFSRMGT
jgi:hypothetical protein